MRLKPVVVVVVVKVPLVGLLVVLVLFRPVAVTYHTSLFTFTCSRVGGMWDRHGIARRNRGRAHSTQTGASITAVSKISQL